MNTSLYLTTIIHQRINNFEHKFMYKALSMFIDTDELNIISKKIKFFSYNKFNIFSFYEKDHGYRDGRALREFVEDYLNINKIKFKNLEIKIMCFPRILGYVFNPLSIIYCYNNKKLVSIFYEVKNTSNEQHTYCFADNMVKNDNLSHQCKKLFYVSPFIGMNAIYNFKNSSPKNNFSVVIDLFDESDKKILTASQYGIKLKLKSYSLLKQILINPFSIIKVSFAIVYEAFFILLKGGKYYSRQKKIKDTISFEGKL